MSHHLSRAACKDSVPDGTGIRTIATANALPPTACAPQTLGPNGTLGADAMASLMTAELFDIVTDSYNLGGYYDRLGLEPASKCAWAYGTTYTAPNGAKAKVKLGGRDYLLQQLWLPSKSSGVCGMHL